MRLFLAVVLLPTLAWPCVPVIDKLLRRDAENVGCS